MTTVGRINKIPLKRYDFEWQIQDFFSLSEKGNKSFISPSFPFADAFWCLSIYSNQFCALSGKRVSLYLRRISSGSPIELEFGLRLKTVDGKREPELHRTYIFKRPNTGFGGPSHLSMCDLLHRKYELLPFDVLTVVCTLRHPDSVEDADVVSLRQDYLKVLRDGQNHDLILKVGDKELRAHQDILRARSRVFESMLSHNMTERNNGVIEIPDCDPQAMELFLSYMYCGKIDTLNQSTVVELYYIADKYDMESLKEECCDFIKQSLSPTNTCEILQLALNHSDSDLLEHTTDYFRKNVLEIMPTAEWQSFLKNNFTLGNELLIKSFEKFKCKSLVT